VIRGHHLRSNQYLLAQVYNDTEATANWKDAVVKPRQCPAN
jgi:major vault protein